MRCIILSSVACLALPYFFFRISHKRHDFFGGKKEVIKHKVCVLISSATFFSETSLILTRTERDINVKTCSYNVPVILF